MSPMTAGCTGKRVLIRLFAFPSKRMVRVLRTAIAVLSGRVYGMCMVRGDVVIRQNRGWWLLLVSMMRLT